jgi:hypothetical protein
MSSFSDWNGPGCGGGGGTIPQLQTLQTLLTQITVLTDHINEVRAELNTHKITDVPTVHTQITADYTKLIQDLKTAIIGANGYIDNNTKVTTAVSDIAILNGTVGTSGSVLYTLNPTKVNAESAIAGVDKLNAGAHSAGSVDYKIAQSIGAFDSSLKSLQTMVWAADKLIKTDEINSFTADGIIDILSEIKATLLATFGNINMGPTLDFTKYKRVRASISPVTRGTGATGPATVAILGCLSKNLTDTEQTIDEDYKEYKPGRAYIKFVDTNLWNAIVDMAAVVSSGGNYTGSMDVTIAKVDSAQEVTFGLYHGSSVDDATNQIYLGVDTKDVPAVPVVADSTTSYYTSLFYYVAGVDFIPLNSKNAPNGQVAPIVEHAISESDSTVVSNLVAGSVATDKYLDAAGHAVIIVDEAKKTIDIGAKTKGKADKDIAMYSGSRLVVYDNNGQKHNVLYDEDLGSSIQWQRTVTVLAENLAALNPSMSSNNDYNVSVTGTPGNYTVIPRAPGALRVPGVYTTDPTQPNPKGIIFGQGTDSALALIKDSKATIVLADGITTTPLNVTHLQATNVPINTITAREPKVKSVIRGFSSTGAEVYASIQSITDGIALCITIDITDKNDDNYYTEYTKPAYCTFADGEWALGDIIDVPTNNDGCVSDITYEWFGLRTDTGDTFFAASYILWTAHYENPNYGDTEWSFINLPLEGYRPAGQQDVIDESLLEYRMVQSDYDATDQTILWTLPGQDEKRIANPAYIHNKPWVGMTLLDSGSFIQPAFAEGFLCDGGDFSNISADRSQSSVAADHQFANAIIKLWRGNHDDVPVNIGNYSSTLRWESFTAAPNEMLEDPTNESELVYADTTGPKRFIPIDSYQVKTETSVKIQQTQTFGVDETDDALVKTNNYTDFGSVGQPRAGADVVKFVSDEVDDLKTLAFSVSGDTVSITSPRLDALDTGIGDALKLYTSEHPEQEPANETQQINSDIVLGQYDSGNGVIKSYMLLGRAESQNRDINLISVGRYTNAQTQDVYEQVEVATENLMPLCLNHNARSDDTEGSIVGPNIIVNYKDEDGGEHPDKVAYLELDIAPITTQLTDLAADVANKLPEVLEDDGQYQLVATRAGADVTYEWILIV